MSPFLPLYAPLTLPPSATLLPTLTALPHSLEPGKVDTGCERDAGLLRVGANLGRAGLVEEVNLDKLEVVVDRLAGRELFHATQRLDTAVAQVVDHGHAVPRVQKLEHGVGPDEAGASCHKDVIARFCSSSHAVVGRAWVCFSLFLTSVRQCKWMRAWKQISLFIWSRRGPLSEEKGAVCVVEVLVGYAGRNVGEISRRRGGVTQRRL